MSAARKFHETYDDRLSCPYCNPPKPLKFEEPSRKSAQALSLAGLYATAVLVLGLLFGPGLLELAVGWVS